MNKKFSWTREDELKPIKQEDLICKDCFHRSGRTDICAVYQNIKPTKVFHRGKCEYYKKED